MMKVFKFLLEAGLFSVMMFQGLHAQVSDTQFMKRMDFQFNLIDTLLKKKNLDLALEKTMVAKKDIETNLGKTNATYIRTLNILEYIHWNKNEKVKSIEVSLEKLEIIRLVFGPESIECGVVNFKIGYSYQNIKNETKAERYYLDAKRIYELLNETKQSKYAWILNNLGNVNRTLGRLEESERYHLEAATIRKTYLGVENNDYAASLMNLANLYRDKNQFNLAEKYLNESLELSGKINGIHSAEYSDNLVNFGVLYYMMGIWKKAEEYAKKALTIRLKLFGDSDPYYAEALDNLGMSLYEQGKTDTALGMSETAGEIFLNAYGPANLDYTFCLNNQANMYSKLKQYQTSVLLYKAVIRNFDTIGFHKDHSFRLAACLSVAEMYSKLMQKDSAVSYLNQVKDVVDNSQFLMQEHYPQVLNGIANVLHQFNDDVYAMHYYKLSESIQFKLLREKAAFLTDDEMLSYLNNKMRYNDERTSFYIDHFREYGSELTGMVYNTVMDSKNYLLENQRELYGKLRLSTDSSIMVNYTEWKNIKRQLEYIVANGIVDSSGFTELENKAEILERKLTRSSQTFEEYRKVIDYRDISSRLAPNEAAIEFFNYRYVHPYNSVDSIIYSALILRHGDKMPKYVYLFEEKQLKSKFETIAGNSEFVSILYGSGKEEFRSGELLDRREIYGTALYNLIWKPIDSLLTGVKKVYFSPSGLLHKVNISALPVSDTKLLMDIYQLNQLGSTKSIFKNTTVIFHKSENTCIFGDIDYNLNVEFTDGTEIIKYDNLILSYLDRDRMSNEEGFKYLPGTRDEINKIGKLLEQKNCIVQKFYGSAASEEKLKDLGAENKNSPGILHLATHAFFFSDSKDQNNSKSNRNNQFRWNENPLFRSGLVLAGANLVWNGDTTTKVREDGIVTAYEISHLNLENTKLVVLSACETALGDVRGSEGVYGLQRAFKIAGAKYLIASLWQVPDKESAEFMELFYKSWIQGQEIHKAFQKAQKQMRQKNRNIYKWGAWVLIE